jgi:hypothetical protein
MRSLKAILLLGFVVMVAAASAYIIGRVASGAEVGPPTALCPGPDEYGYVCQGEPLFEYVDASQDTMLYQDDDTVLLDLPFTFTFYGTEYDELWASSNGILLFTTASSDYDNGCLVPQPAAGMGDMIAPYWDDLNLTFSGLLETELVGQAPERIFVVEWDQVPKFGSTDDTLTFEVQLFEGSNDIVFLYRDAQTLQGPYGSQATIGLQSELQGYALQAGCNQNALFDGSTIHFRHPDSESRQQAAAAGPSQSAAARPGSQEAAIVAAKGAGARLVLALNSQGRQGLTGLKLALLNERPRLESEWLWADLDGDGQEEVVYLWRGEATRPELLEVAIAGQDGDGRWQLRGHAWPLARQERLVSLGLAAQGDVTGNGRQEIILRDPVRGALAALMAMPGGYELVEMPGRCSGSLLVRDEDGDGAEEIILGGCPGGQRWTVRWDGQAFVAAAGR